MKSFDLKRRSLLKTLSYRFFGTFTTMMVVYLLTDQWSLGLTAGLMDFIAKIFLFYFHERSWDHVTWGRKDNSPAVIWFTGFSGAGKSALADRLYLCLKTQGFTTELLDGDAIRAVFKDTGFTRPERLRHLYSMAFIASKLEKQGSIVLGAFITPYEEARETLRQACQKYIEVWVDTSLDQCEQRDVKGLYARARRGEITSFSGISDAYEVPTKYDIRISTEGKTVDESFDDLVRELKKKLPGLSELKLH